MDFTAKQNNAYKALVNIFEDGPDEEVDTTKVFDALVDLDRDLIATWRDRLDEILDLHSDVESLAYSYEDAVGDTDNEDNDDPEDVKVELLDTINSLTDLIDEVM